MTRYTDTFLGFLELQALIILCASLSGCAVKKPIDQPGVHHYEHCHEVIRDVKNNTVTVVCPLENQNGIRH